jgi:hypothetical protein
VETIPNFTLMVWISMTGQQQNKSKTFEEIKIKPNAEKDKLNMLKELDDLLLFCLS